MDQQYIRPSKDASFMEIAQSVSMRSTCLRRRYGAVIVSKDGRIVSTGYNGAPRHRANCTDLKYCLRDKLKIKPGTHYELCRSVHAEANAIINGNPLDIIGGTLYLAGTEAATNKPSKYISPCAMCQRLILNAQIERVVLRDENGNIIEVNPLEWDDDAKLLEAYAKQQETGETADLSSHSSCGCCGGESKVKNGNECMLTKEQTATEQQKTDSTETEAEPEKKAVKKIEINIDPAPKCRCGNYEYCRCGD